MVKQKSDNDEYFIDLTIEAGLLVGAFLFERMVGTLVIASHSTTFLIGERIVLLFPLLGLIFVQKSSKWRRFTLWLPAVLYLIFWQAGIILFLLRLFNWNDILRKTARIVLICLLVPNFFGRTIMLLYTCIAGTDVIESRIGNSNAWQYLDLFANVNPSLVIERRLYLVPNLYFGRSLCEIPNASNLIDIKALDYKRLEFVQGDKTIDLNVDQFNFEAPYSYTTRTKPTFSELL